VRLGIAGQAVAVVPVGLAAALAWQMGERLRMWPWQSRPVSTRMVAAVACVVLVSVAAFTVTAAARGWIAGVTAGSIVYAAVAWVTVIRWRAGVEAAGPQGLAGPALARAVAFDMLPFSDRVRRRGAQAERDRLASDLHAEVLPAIALAAAALEQRGATDEAEQLRGLVASVRDLVSDRRLPILEDQGLVAAAEWLAESLQERAGLAIEITLGGDNGARHPAAVERVAYRVLQLSLENVIRHARAANAFVDIAGDADSLDLAVADDGRGMDKHAAARALHDGRLGLADMRREAESVGASLAIAPRSPHGTVVGMRWRA
jgi:signal transduction histidine kinase